MKTIRTAVLLTSSLLAFSYTSLAQTFTWTGGGGAVNNNFLNSANWLDGQVPEASGTYRNIVFGESQSGYYGPLNQDNSNFRLQSLLFTQEAGSYVIGTGSGDEPIWLNRGGSYGTGGAITNRSAYEQRINTQILLNWSSNSFFTLDTGVAGIMLAGGIQMVGATNATIIEKTGSGVLTLAGENAFDRLLIRSGSVVLDANDANADLSFTHPAAFSFYGGDELRIIGKSGSHTTNLTLTLGATTHFTNHALSSLRAARIHLDANGGLGTHLVFNHWLGDGGRSGDVANVTTLNYRLGEDTSVHFNQLSNNILGVDNVVYWSTVTTPNGAGTRTGFLQLAGNLENGYDVTRYEGYTLLPGNQSGLTGGHYYVSGSHTIAGGTSSEANAARTLTLQGTGTLSITGGAMRIANILLEEGVGDYTISATAGGLNPSIGSASQGRAGTMTIHQYRTTGDLIVVANNIFGTRLVTTGPGKTILRPTAVNFTHLYVQEGTLQLESNGLSAVTQAHVYAGTLAGSGQIGTASTPVRIYQGGTIDATPTGHVSVSGLRGLQVSGSLQLDDESALAMTLNHDVLNGTYNPLHVTGAVTLANGLDISGVDLSIAMTAHYTGPEHNWRVILLTTDDSITGEFGSVNGQAFGPGNSFMVQYDNVNYYFSVQYGDLGDGVKGIAIQAIPEPSIIGLLFGGSMLVMGFILRRRKRI